MCAMADPLASPSGIGTAEPDQPDARGRGNRAAEKVHKGALLLIPIALALAATIGATMRHLHNATRLEALYQAGAAAAASGRSLESFLAFHQAWLAAPDYQDVRVRLSEAAARAATEIPPGTSPTDELVLLRWLNAEDNVDVLASALDRSEVVIPAGEFWMGSDGGQQDESPARLVLVDAFAIDRYEVTNVQYRRFVVDTSGRAPRYWTGADYPQGQSDVPIVGVTWDEAQAYCAWAGKRLPTEAEWERACRGGDGRVYPWGNAWDVEAANLGLIPRAPVGEYIDATWPILNVTPASAGEAGLRPIGSFPAGVSPDGVMDLVGSVTEWVSDFYVADAYRILPDTNPVNLEPPWAHVLRGSSWLHWLGTEAALADCSRCAARNSSHSSDDPRVGFRCARSIP